LFKLNEENNIWGDKDGRRKEGWRWN
jgi:hypothetical protein